MSAACGCEHHHHHDDGYHGHHHEHHGACCGHRHEHVQGAWHESLAPESCHGQHGDCHHEHEHEHEHGTETVAEVLHFKRACVQLEAHTHEQAAAVSLRVQVKHDALLPCERIVRLLQDIAARAAASGGVVGHIKGFARQAGATFRVSVTAAGLEPSCEGNRSLPFDSSADIQLVAIVLLLPQEVLQVLVRQALGQHFS